MKKATRYDAIAHETNVPEVGHADSSEPDECALHSKFGFAFTGARGVLKMSTKHAVKNGGVWTWTAA